MYISIYIAAYMSLLFLKTLKYFNKSPIFQMSTFTIGLLKFPPKLLTCVCTNYKLFFFF